MLLEEAHTQMVHRAAGLGHDHSLEFGVSHDLNETR